MKTKINLVFLIAIIMIIEFSTSQGICGGCCGNNQNNGNSSGQVVNNLDYFTGNWVGLDYTCDTGSKILEQINFPKLNYELYAKKVTGDNCVNAGQITFRFKQYPSELLYKTYYPVTWTVGYPQYPQSSMANGQLEITSKDEFIIDGYYKFVRGRLDRGVLVKEYATVPPPKPCKHTTIREITRQVIDDKGKVLSQTRERIIETVAERYSDVWYPTDTILSVFNNQFETKTVNVVKN